MDFIYHVQIWTLAIVLVHLVYSVVIREIR